MTSIAEFTLEPDDFPLGAVFETRPGVRLELDRVVPSGDTVMPFFWVYDPECDLASVLAVFEDLPELRSIRLVEDLDDRGLFRAEWHPDHLGIMTAIPESGVTVLSATGSSDGWVFELRSPTADRFSVFQDYCTDLGVSVTLSSLGRVSGEGGTDYGLTPEQTEALQLAYREGYYDDPRETDQQKLAERLDITRQALSSRLRRGYRNLVENTVVSRHRDEK